MKWLFVVWLLLTGCGVAPAADTLPKVWTAKDFLERHEQAVDFGGWTPSQLLVTEGQALPFASGTHRGGPALVLFPGVSEGESAPFVITDVWRGHAQPWVQPVWGPVDADGHPVENVRNVFPVDVGASFYSPFWQLIVLPTPGLTPTTYRRAREVLNARVEKKLGPLVLCPFVPPEVGVQDEGMGPIDPATGATLKPVGSSPGLVESELHEVHDIAYLNFGIDRAPWKGQSLEEALAYFFVRAPDEPPLPVAAVLPARPLQHALVRRVDVVLPAGSGVYVPSTRPELRALMERLQVPAPLPRVDQNPFTLRVALNRECFAAADFPETCQWLDSAQKVQALLGASRKVRPIQLTVGVLVPR
jgi:hypothetical protein